MTATYPMSIKSFLTYEDQHGPVTGPDDKSIIYAYIVNEIHDEVLAVEKIMGLHPFTSPGLTDLGSTLKSLVDTKSPRLHTHTHFSLLWDSPANDHPQYSLTNGTSAFTSPVNGIPGNYGNQLITLGQVQSMQASGQLMTGTDIQNAVAASLAAFGVTCTGAPCVIAGAGTPPGIRGTGQGPEIGPPPATSQWVITGGGRQGYTDLNGMLNVSFGQAFRSTVVAFIFMRLPMPETSVYGYKYQYMEDQLLLHNISPSGATVQFAEDVHIDRQAWVNMCWIGIGF